MNSVRGAICLDKRRIMAGFEIDPYQRSIRSGTKRQRAARTAQLQRKRFFINMHRLVVAIDSHYLMSYNNTDMRTNANHSTQQ
jgi:hypothetical protein